MSSAKSTSKAWKRFKLPTYRVGDILFNVRLKKIFEVKQAFPSKDEYFIVEAGKGYKEQLHVDNFELMFYRIRKATYMEIILYS